MRLKVSNAELVSGVPMFSMYFILIAIDLMEISKILPLKVLPELLILIGVFIEGVTLAYSLALAFVLRNLKFQELQSFSLGLFL